MHHRLRRPHELPPTVYGGTPAVLYHNNGDGTFTNVTKAAKIFQPKGLNLSVGAYDYDNDGWPDLFVANDGIEAYLYHNNHNGTFTEMAVTSGMALTSNGNAMAAMCISLGDYDNDGNLGLYISDFQLIPDHVWLNDGKGFFEEMSEHVGRCRANATRLELRRRFLRLRQRRLAGPFHRQRPRVRGSGARFAGEPLQADQFTVP